MSGLWTHSKFQVNQTLVQGDQGHQNVDNW